MKEFSCRDVGFACDFVAHEESNEEVLKDFAQHAQQVHRIVVTPDLENRAKWLIHDARSQPTANL